MPERIIGEEPGARVWPLTTYTDPDAAPGPDSRLAVKACVPIVRTCAEGENEGKGEGNGEVIPLTVTAEADGARE